MRVARHIAATAARRCHGAPAAARRRGRARHRSTNAAGGAGVVVLPHPTLPTSRVVARVLPNTSATGADADPASRSVHATTATPPAWTLRPLRRVADVHADSPVIMLPPESPARRYAHLLAATSTDSVLRLHRCNVSDDSIAPAHPTDDTPWHDASQAVARAEVAGPDYDLMRPTGDANFSSIHAMLHWPAPQGAHSGGDALYVVGPRPEGVVDDADEDGDDKPPSHWFALETLDVTGLRRIRARDNGEQGGDGGRDASDVDGDSDGHNAPWCSIVHDADARFPLWSNSMRCQVPSYFRDSRKHFDALLALPAFDFSTRLDAEPPRQSGFGHIKSAFIPGRGGADGAAEAPAPPQQQRRSDIRPALCGVDNIVMPKWNLVFDARNPVAAVLERAVDIGAHGTYETISHGCVGRRWVALLSSSFNHGTSYKHIALHDASTMLEHAAVGLYSTPTWAGHDVPPAWSAIAFVEGTDRLLIAGGSMGVVVLDVDDAMRAGGEAAADMATGSTGGDDDDDDDSTFAANFYGGDRDTEVPSWRALPSASRRDVVDATVQQRMIHVPVASHHLRVAARVGPPERGGSSLLASNDADAGGSTESYGNGSVIDVVPVPGYPSLAVAVMIDADLETQGLREAWSDDNGAYMPPPHLTRDCVVVELPDP